MGLPAEKINSDSIEDDIYNNTHPRLIEGGSDTAHRSSANIQALKESEESPEKLDSSFFTNEEGSNLYRGNWQNNTNKIKSDSIKPTGKLKLLKLLKGKGPAALISSLIIAMLLELMVFFVPGGLLMNLKEVITKRFNNQLASMEIRSTKLMASKLKVNSGVCSSKITIKCKYSTMSEKQIKNLKASGIEVAVDESESKTLTGRSKVKGLIFDDKTISAENLNDEIMKNPKFRSAIHKAYNAKFAGFADKVWTKFSSKKKISKAAPDLEGKDDDAKLKKIQDVTKGDAKNSKSNATIDRDKTNNPETGKPYTDDEWADLQKEMAKANGDANSISGEADNVAKTGVKAGTEVVDSVETAVKSGASSISGALGIAGFASSACTAYGSVQALGYAAKAVRSMQLISYSMIFLNVADQIKAGTAKPKDVEFLGKILTTEYIKKDGKKGKSATDSYGFKYAAYGDTGKMSTSASQYLTAGGLTGNLIGITDLINSATDNKPKKVCKFMGNPIVSGASLVAGIALMLIPGVDVAIGAKDIAQMAFQVALNLAAPAITAMLADIIAGVVVDNKTFGEASGDAIVSGAASMMSGAAAAGGNSPLTSSQAVKYNELTLKTAALYAEEDRLAYSPFDVTNSNTFMGNIYSQLLPYLSKMSSLSGSINSIMSLSTNSLAFATSQTTKAITQSDYEMCKDFDYNDLKGDGNDTTDDKVATDPYCNIIYGIPTEYLDKDPIKVIEELGGEIDESTGNPAAGSNYETFVKDCVNRDRPLGDSGEDFSKDDGSKCLFNDKNANYYLHYIDQRVDEGFDSMYDGSSGTSSTAGATIDVANLYNDSTSIACAAGTTDAGTADGYTDGQLVKIRLCTIPNTLDTDENLPSSRGITVNSRVSGAWLALINEMLTTTSQSTITASSSFRTMEMQQADKAQYGGGAAEPGYSNHQMGLAIDFASLYGSSSYSKGSKAEYDFLSYNGGGKKYGFNQIDGEAWHWEPIH